MTDEKKRRERMSYEKEPSGEHSITLPTGRKRRYHQRKSFAVVYNGTWWSNILQVNLNFLKVTAVVITSLGIIGGAMAAVAKFIFADKIKDEMVRTIRAEIKPLADQSNDTTIRLASHLSETVVWQLEYVTDEELEVKLRELRVIINEIERRQYQNRRDLERIKE